ncbi:MAG: TonB-dependent siderophore receptor, partial [Pseudomonas sp.]
MSHPFIRHRLARQLQVALFGVGIIGAPLLHAAEPASNAAAAEQVRQYDIAPGPLVAVLGRFAAASGVALSFDAAQLGNRQSPGLRGSYALDAGFAHLLQGSGLRALNTSGSYVLEKAVNSGDVLELGATTVTGEQLGAITEGTGSYTTGSTSAATGMNLSLRETPQSVTVVTRQRMDDQALDSLADVLAQTPGVSATGSSSQASNALTPAYSRGYLLTRFQVDGAMASPGTFSGSGLGWYGLGGLQTVLYDSVTVVRGPTGLLSGTGDPSGSINLVRKRPTDTFQGTLTGSMGRWDQYRTTADVGGPLNEEGTLRGRLVASYDETASWVERYQQERRVGYAVLDADLGDA